MGFRLDGGEVRSVNKGHGQLQECGGESKGTEGTIHVPSFVLIEESTLTPSTTRNME